MHPTLETEERRQAQTTCPWKPQRGHWTEPLKPLEISMHPTLETEERRQAQTIISEDTETTP
jgi:hypothetical protein